MDKKAEKVCITAAVSCVFDELKNQVNRFLIHRYIKRKQAAHMEKILHNCDGESILLQIDFSENASLMMQNEIQSAHWNHSQVTIFTAHAWIDENNKESFALISNCLDHTKEAVYTFMTFLYKYLLEKYPSIKLINTFSDGAASQFKQRYLFSNIPLWEINLKIQILWHFFATSHGKGAVDGIGGTVKRSVWRSVKAGADAPIDAVSYSEIAKDRNPNINVIYISADEVKTQSDPMTDRWNAVLPVANTLKLHCIRSQSSTKLSVSITSSDNEFTVVDLFKSDDSDSETDNCNDNDVEEQKEANVSLTVGEWVLVSYDGTNFPGEILKIVGEECEVTVMHQSGKFWKWPQKEDKIFYNQKNIIKRLGQPQVAGSRGQFIFEGL